MMMELVLTLWGDEFDGSELSCPSEGFVSSGFIDLVVGWPSAAASAAGLALRFAGAPRSRGWSSSRSGGSLSTLGWWAWAGGGPLDEAAESAEGGGGGRAAEEVWERWCFGRETDDSGG